MAAPVMLVASTKADPVVHHALLEEVEAHHVHLVEVEVAVLHDLLEEAEEAAHHDLLVAGEEAVHLMVVEVAGDYLPEAAEVLVVVLVVLAPL
jgi:hypothetical protein